MGYFLLYESMLDTVLLARDKYLVSFLSSAHPKAKLISRPLAVSSSPTKPPSSSLLLKIRTTRKKRSTVSSSASSCYIPSAERVRQLT
jgi:hypothetical protein